MRSSDKYEKRARELAIAAGLDPDDRVGEGRGMPVWCTFRAAARQEHVVKEAGAVELPPQAPAYQNSPLKVFGEHEAHHRADRRCMGVGSVAGGVLCADGHLGYAQPVGGVVAYEDQSPSRASASTSAAATWRRASNLVRTIKERVGIIHDIAKVISFGVGRNNEAGRPRGVRRRRGVARVRHALRQMARQLGTVGSGNHYVDLFDDEGLVWIGVHFGSRGLGHKSATQYLKAAGGKDGIDVPPAVIVEASELGQRYLAAMTLAGEYAYAGREWVWNASADHRGAETDRVHNHHNYAWRERHGERDLWVVRKGATPAFPGQRGFVGGSMGDDAVILVGHRERGSARLVTRPCTAPAACSRRREAKRRVRRDAMQAWLREKGVTWSARIIDEARRPTPPVRRARATRGHDQDRAHAASVHRRDGGRRRVRSVQGLGSNSASLIRTIVLSLSMVFSENRCPLFRTMLSFARSARIVADLLCPLADREDLLPAAVQAFVGLQLLVGLRRMRLEAREVHRATATANRQQEWVARASCGKRSRHGVVPPVGCRITRGVRGPARHAVLRFFALISRCYRKVMSPARDLAALGVAKRGIVPQRVPGFVAITPHCSRIPPRQRHQRFAPLTMRGYGPNP